MISLLILVLFCAVILIPLDLISYFYRRTGWARFVSTFLLFYGQIIATEFLLGLFSLLTGFWLVVSNLLVSLVITYVLYRRFGKIPIRKYAAHLRPRYSALKKQLRNDPLWGVLLFLAAAVVAWIAFLGIIFPATDWDGNSYHLTFTANVIQNHTFFDPQTSLKWLAGYPKGGEFAQMWSAIITHNDMFTDIAQLPFLFLGVYSLYALSRRLGIDAKQARFTALLFVFLPIVFNQLKTTYVDVMLCSLFFAGLALVVKEKLTQLDILLVGIVLSLLISIKSTGLLFAVALMPLLVWNVNANRGPKDTKVVRYYAKTLAWAIPPLIFGLYWYIKNYIAYGSPIYPFGFKLGGMSIFPGQTFQEFAANAVNGSTLLPHGSFARIWFVWTEQKDWFGCMYNYDTNYAGFGPLWFIVFLPSLAIATYLAIKKRNKLFLGVIATIAALFVVYPANYYTRYTIFVTSIGILALGLVLTHFSKLSRTIIKVLSLLLVVVVIGTNFTLCNFAPGTVRDQFSSFIHGSERGPVYSNVPGKAYVYIEQQERPGDTVAYDSSPYFIYPLWRPDFKNKVIYIRASNKTEWINQLHKKHVRFVFTTLQSKEQHWADKSLKSIYKDEMYEIYKVY